MAVAPCLLALSAAPHSWAFKKYVVSRSARWPTWRGGGGVVVVVIDCLIVRSPAWLRRLASLRRRLQRYLFFPAVPPYWRRRC